MANLSWLHLALLLFIHISQTTHANKHKHKQNGLSLRLIHRDSLDSFSYKSNLTVEEKTERLIHFYEAQIKSLKSLSKDDNYSLFQVINNQVSRPSLYHQFPLGTYLVQVGLGTFEGSRPPFKTYYLQLDTGGGPIWTQCQGCNPCFHQRDPVFPKNQSRTYRAFPCNRCPSRTTCVENHCRNQHSYEDGSRVQGIAASETFTFSSNIAGLFTAMQNVRFTCVIRSNNVIFGRRQSNIASGIFGMNRDSSSFMSQVGTYLGGRFSYCLTPMHYHDQQPHMFLRFGDDIPYLTSMHRTPFIQGPDPGYYLDLQSITVGSEPLNVNPSIYQLRNGLGGCVIDSGAGASRLINVAYREFERILTQKVIAKNSGISIYYRDTKLCFKQPRPNARTKFPKLTFHFANYAKFVVQPQAYMVGFEYPNPQEYCLSIVSSDKFTVLGASQQVNHRIIYDINNSELQFEPTDCLSNN